MGDRCKFLYGLVVNEFLNFEFEKLREFSLVLSFFIIGIRYELDEEEEVWE